jgi:hypothetical protein
LVFRQVTDYFKPITTQLIYIELHASLSFCTIAVGYEHKLNHMQDNLAALKDEIDNAGSSCVSSSELLHYGSRIIAETDLAKHSSANSLFS